MNFTFWPALHYLAQPFYRGSLLESWTWPTIWANPVQILYPSPLPRHMMCVGYCSERNPNPTCHAGKGKVAHAFGNDERTKVRKNAKISWPRSWANFSPL